MQGIVDIVRKWNLKLLIRLFVVVGIVLVLVSSYLGYTRLYLDDERRFWIAIENSMSTPSVVRTLTSGGTGNQVVQQQQMVFGDEPKIVSKVTFEQRGATSNTTVVTEGVAFMNEQYSRYTVFNTDQPQPDGTPTQIDDLLNKWEVLGGGFEEDADLARQNFVGELVSLAIFGNYDADFKRDMISQLKENSVYNIDFNSVIDDEVNGEEARVYPATVLLQGFAEAISSSFERAGYGTFPPLDPANYDPAADLQVAIAVSERTGAIIGLSYGSRQEAYSGYGIQKVVDRPDPTFRDGELEQRVQEALGGVL